MFGTSIEIKVFLLCLFRSRQADDIDDEDLFTDLEDTDYVPGTSSESSDTDQEMEVDREIPNLSHLAQDPGWNRSDDTDREVPPAQEISKVNVQTMQETKSPIRNPTMIKRATKDQCCFYCGKYVKKMGRHLLSVHVTEPEVAKIAHLPAQDSCRKKELDRLRNVGNFKNNMKVFSSGTGTIIPSRRPSRQLSHRLYLPCPSCFGMFRKENLWRHKKKCVKSDSKKPRSMVQAEASTLIPNPLANDELSTHVLSRMRMDTVGETVRRDSLILQFGSRLLHKHRAEEHLHLYVSTKMREVGRLLIELQSHVSRNDLKDFLKPSYFQLMIRSVLNVSKSNKGTEAVPSLALKLGHSLKKCGQLLRSQHLMANDFEAARESEIFVSLLENDWAELVSHHALQQLKRRKENQPALLPLTEDIKQLMKYLDAETSRLLVAMNNSPCMGLWKDLAEVLLSQVILFNRRRAGEVERLQTTSCKHLLDGENFPSQSSLDAELLESLSPFEQKLIEKMTRIETRGKRGRSVAIILSPSMTKSLKTLLETRSSVGIPTLNTHVFACPPSSSLNGYKSVQKIVKACPGLKQPENITSTKLRKHIASLSQVMNLHDNEMDLLASHMGHDIRVHREYYRLPQDILETAKVGKLLVMMEKGDLQHMKGKTLKELDLPVDDDLLESEDEDDDTFVHDTDEIAKWSQDDDDGEKEVHPQKRADCTWLKDSENETLTEDCVMDSGVKSLTEHSKTEGISLSLKSRHSSTLPATKGKRCIHKKWSEEEKSAVERHLGLFIANRKVPGKGPTTACLEKEPVFKARGRTWKDVKSFVHNVIMALKRKK